MPEPSPDEPADAEWLSPDEAFSLLGNETRFRILQALWEAHDPRQRSSPVGFSDLYDRVDIADSGNFNYHLDQLRGHFVTQTDDGYELTNAGMKVVKAVIAGTVTTNPSFGPREVDETCPRCGAPVVLTYDDEQVIIRCTECPGLVHGQGYPDGMIAVHELPPVGLEDRTADEVFSASVLWNHFRGWIGMEGICPECSGTMDRSVRVCDDHDPGEDGICDACETNLWGVATYLCTTCKTIWRIPTWVHAMTHPAVIAFYYDHGIELSPASWGGSQRAREYREERLSTDPLRILVEIPVEDDTLHVTLDEDLSVVEVAERPPA